MATEKATHVYVGRCRGCGSIRAGRVETMDDLADVGQWVAEMIAGGLVVERVPCEPPIGFERCKCEARPAAGAGTDGPGE